MSTKEFPSSSSTATLSTTTVSRGGHRAQKKEVDLPLLPRKRDRKFYLYICIFVLQTESDLKSTADVIFQLICLCVIPGSPSLRNLGTAWIVGCGALRVTALCQLLLGNQEHSPAIPRNNVSSYLFPLKKKKIPPRSVLKSLCT